VDDDVVDLLLGIVVGLGLLGGRDTEVDDGALRLLGAKRALWIANSISAPFRRISLSGDGEMINQ
jgi:hypothetical protein